VENGAEAWKKDEFDKSPILRACYYVPEEVIRLLVSLGADDRYKIVNLMSVCSGSGPKILGLIW